MRIRKIIGRALSRMVQQQYYIGPLTVDGHAFSIFVIPKDQFHTVPAYIVASPKGRIAYPVKMSPAETVNVWSKWNIDSLNNELAASDGILIVHGGLTPTDTVRTIRTFSGKYDQKCVEKLCVQLNEVRKRERDSQRKALYQFEHRVLLPYLARNVDEDSFTLSAKKAKALSDKVLSDYDLKDRCEFLMTTTRSETRVGMATTVYGDSLSATPDFTRAECHFTLNGVTTVQTVLHELAHAVTQHELGRTASAHGEQFTATYIELLARYLNLSIAELIKLFRSHKIKVDAQSIFDYKLGRWNRSCTRRTVKSRRMKWKR